MTKFVFLNGEFLNRKDAKVSAFDKGFLFGEGLFEQFRIYELKAFQMSQHYERLKSSARQLKVPLTINLPTFREIVSQLLRLNDIKNAIVRIVISTGSRDAIHSPTTLVEVTGDIPSEYDKYQEEGATITVYPEKRSAYTRVYRYNTLSRIENILAKRYAYEQQSMEAIFMNHKMEVTEGYLSNVFIVKARSGLTQTPLSRILSSNRVVYTAPLSANISPGITRQVIMGLCTKNGIKVREKMFKLKNLLTADEIFLTNSLMGVVPVKKIIYNDRIIRIGESIPDLTTQLLVKEYNAIIA
ncbi:MAG: aminotransferase class IV [Candidatus Brocadiia bacterium]